MLKAHLQAWVWQDEWYGLTMEVSEDKTRVSGAIKIISDTLRQEGATYGPQATSGPRRAIFSLRLAFLTEIRPASLK